MPETVAQQSGGGMTVPEVAELLRVSPDKIRLWIKAGELGCVNVGSALRPRFVVLPSHLAEWERGRRVAARVKPPRRRRRVGLTDYYPEVPAERQA